MALEEVRQDLEPGASGSTLCPAPSQLHDISQEATSPFWTCFIPIKGPSSPMMLESSEQDKALQKYFLDVGGSGIWQLEGARERHPSLSHFTLLNRGVGGRSRSQPEISSEIPLSTGGLETVLWALGGTAALRVAPSLAPCEGEGRASCLPQFC